MTYDFVKTDWGRVSFQLFMLIGGLALISIDSTSSNQINQEITTLQPNIVFQSTVYEGDVDIVTGNWLTSDSRPVIEGKITISLFLNDTGSMLSISQFATTGDGSYRLELNYTNFLPGDYYWNFKFEKSGYLGWDIMGDVMLIPHNLDVRIDTLPEIVQGEQFIIVAIVKYASVDSDMFGQPASNIEVKFNIQLIYENDDKVDILQITKTNQAGVAFISIPASETERLREVGSIVAEIQQTEQYSAISTELTNLPIVISGNDSFPDRTLELLKKNTVLLAFMTVFFASSTIILLIKRNKIPLKQEMWPKHEK